jgi:hypothetical protein
MWSVLIKVTDGTEAGGFIYPYDEPPTVGELITVRNEADPTETCAVQVTSVNARAPIPVHGEEIAA